MRLTRKKVRDTGMILLMMVVMLCSFLPMSVQASEKLFDVSPDCVNENFSEALQRETENETGEIPGDGKESEEEKPGGEEEEPTIENGLVQQENYYVLYIEGKQVTQEGWQELKNEKFYVGSDGHVLKRMEEADGSFRLYACDPGKAEWKSQKKIWEVVRGKEYYFNTAGICTQIYDTKLKQLSVYDKDKMVFANNAVYLLSDGNMYYFDSKGIRDTAQKWVTISSDERYYINGKGYVASKMVNSNGIWKYYNYDYGKSEWVKETDVWKEIEGKEYYFSPKGGCTKIYDTKTKKCYKYSKGKMKAVKNEICTLRNGKIYYFNGKGIQTTQKGWKKVSGDRMVEVGKKGYVVSKMVKLKGIWKYYNYDYGKSEWVKQKSVWKVVNGREYYFSSKGSCTKIYDTKTKKCYKYSKGKMKAVKNEICTLRNGKIYYFNRKGIRTTQKGWKKVSGDRMVQIGKKGYVVSKMVKTKGTWKYYNYHYGKLKWVKQKNVWKTVKQKKYYFNGSGTCTRIYHTINRKCYDYRDGKMILARSVVRNICGKDYYFGADGIIVSSPGLYFTAERKLVYAEADGHVTKIISGEVLEYTMAGEKVTSCRVKEANFMCYYNSAGILTRKIDLNAPMVALTYDDGPSAHTSAILDILGQYGGKATFFVIGEQVPGYADTVRRAYEMGCEIGNHTYSHQILTSAGTSSIQSQIEMTNTVVRDIIGVSPHVMRPPGGGYNDTVRGVVGMPLILWSIDTLDWKTKNPFSTQSAVLDHVQDGDIVLMHDLYSQTAAASTVIIPELVDRGYQLVTVSELADCRGGILNGMVYRALR